MKRLLAALTLLALLAAATAGPAAAAPRPMVGIGEEHSTIFDDPMFAWLGMRTTRIVVPWDVMRMPHDYERVRVWLDNTRRLGIEPVVAFGRKWTEDGDRELPTVSQFRFAFQRFRAMHWDVKTFIPWNEPNHPKQPTWKRPAQAARFYNAMRAECRTCRIVAGDVLDTPGMTKYLKRYKRHLTRRPRIWGMHNYGDAYAHKWTATTQMLRITRGQLWLTETGGVVRRPRGREGISMGQRVREAAAATRHVLRKAAREPRIRRVYLYQWRADDAAAWDSALLNSAGRMRPAFKIVARFMRRDPATAPRQR